MRSCCLLVSATVVVTMLAGCGIQEYSASEKGYLAGGPKESFVIKLRGEDGIHFIGTMITDCKTQEVSGIVPADYEVTANKLVCTFTKTKGDGHLLLEIWQEEDRVGMVDGIKAVHGEVRVGPDEGSVFTTRY